MGSVLLRRAQHRQTADPAAAGDFARAAISAKIANARSVLQRAARDHADRVLPELIETTVTHPGRGDSPARRGDAPGPYARLEGDAGPELFRGVRRIDPPAEEGFLLPRRSRRPPRDNMNALMSFLYALVTNDVVSACESVGLDPQMGFLHGDRAGRPSLALDLVEELRPMLADRLALSLVNRQQVAGKGFTCNEAGGVEMDAATRKTVLVAYQKRKDEEILHPFLQEKVTVGLLPHVQARLLAKWLRGELDAYPPFFWK